MRGLALAGLAQAALCVGDGQVLDKLLATAWPKADSTQASCRHLKLPTFHALPKNSAISSTDWRVQLSAGWAAAPTRLESVMMSSSSVWPDNARNSSYGKTTDFMARESVGMSSRAPEGDANIPKLVRNKVWFHTTCSAALDGLSFRSISGLL